MTIRLGIQGASGRTGGLLLSVLSEFPEFELSAAVVGPHCSSLGTKAANSVTCTAEPGDFNGIDCWIDFSTPASSLSLAALCAKKGTPLLVATTGHTEEQRKKLEDYAVSCPILLAANTSLGVFAQKEIAVLARSILGDRYDVEISEIHHKMKKDAPSGTGLYLARELLHQDESLVYDRTPRHEERRSNEIGVTSLRGGDVAGEHTIYFFGNGERLEITHRAWDRRIFARGALLLAEKLIRKAPGFYSLDKSLF